MGERLTHPLGLKLQLDGGYVPGFRPSPLPFRLVLPGPMGTPAWNSAVGSNVGKEKERKDAHGGKSAVDRLKQGLMKMQIQNRESHGKKAITGLADSELVEIPGASDKKKPARMAAGVAPLFSKMWAELVKAHGARPHAPKSDSVGVASAYRDADEDARAWEGTFRKFYRHTIAEREATKDPYGHAAVLIMFREMNGAKAPPGFSGHTHGIATDLTTTENGQHWVVNSNYDHQLGWQKTWLYGWLVDNAWRHKFYQLKTETWHWEYHADAAPSACWEGRRSVKERPVKKPHGK